MKILKLAALIAPLFLACCDYSVTHAKAPVLHSTATGERVSNIKFGDPLYNIALTFSALDFVGSGIVDLSPMPICDAAKEVLTLALGIEHGCAGNGRISISHSVNDPAQLFSLFVETVERSGGSVTITDGLVFVQGNGGEASGFDGMPPQGMNSEALAADIAAFTTVNEDYEDVKKAASYSRTGQLTLLPSKASSEAVVALARDIGATIEVVTLTGRPYILGDPTVAETLVSLIQTDNKNVFELPVSYLDQTTLEAYILAYPWLDFAFDADTSRLLITGFADEVREALSSLKTSTPDKSLVTIKGLFFSYSDNDLRKFESDLSFNFASPTASLSSSGSVLDLPLSVVVDHLETQTKVNVVAQPVVTTVYGKAARFNSGSSVPVLGSFDPETGVQNVTYRETGLTVGFKPLPVGSGLTRIDIELEVSSVSGEGVTENPIFDTRSIQTVVDLRKGQTVMLTGLDQSTTQTGKATRFLFPSSNASKADLKLGLFVTLQ